MLAEWTGLEPATPCVTGRYSNQLNYHSSFITFNYFFKNYYESIVNKKVLKNLALLNLL